MTDGAEDQGLEARKSYGLETTEGLSALEDLVTYVLRDKSPDQISFLLNHLAKTLRKDGVDAPIPTTSPYVNTIPPESEPPYPGDQDIERRIKSLIRWNAMAMVVQANKARADAGGHISTYASAATLYEVAYNHFFRGADGAYPGDQVFFQGHASPGIYARAFLEGRLDAEQLANFRRELGPTGGLPSYPHPYLMSDFWQFPTVSMGLGPIMSIYRARFNRYLEARGLYEGPSPRVWCFVGDGEVDEPETLGAISLAAREGLDNLTWVINCNLQRLDGPVRGNAKIIQELEAFFRGGGWNVIKVIWGSDWDDLFAADKTGLLIRRMAEAVDGDYQAYSVEPGSYTRRHFFGKYPELTELISHLTDAQIRKLGRGGHDPGKVYAAYKAATECDGVPTVILAKTIKGYGLGEAGEGRNITHQQKKLNERELREFRERFGVPISDEEIADAPFYRPPDGSEEMQYLHARRRALGGYVPARSVKAPSVKVPDISVFEEFHAGARGEQSTTMVFARLLGKLMREKGSGQQIVPIIPDEARTFGLDALFRQFGIYSALGQKYDPVDRENLLYYREAVDGQILEEGINEAGAMAEFIAAGTSYANHGINMMPFYIFYSMFGFQRIGDLIWAAADSRTKGFLLGATAGRTTLSGEGLQHQDGHGHLYASTVPTLLPYDPAFGYEVAVIIRDGMRRMYEDGEELFYYMTLYNENMAMPAMPEGVGPGILKGLYRFHATDTGKPADARILASGPLIGEAIAAQEALEARHGLAVDVWSATSYPLLRRDALEVERWNRLHPEAPPRSPYVAQQLGSEDAVSLAVSDNVTAVPDLISRWVPGGMTTLGTDGFGRSDTRAGLRRAFQIDAPSIVVATLEALARTGRIGLECVTDAIREYDIDADSTHPMSEMASWSD